MSTSPRTSQRAPVWCDGGAGDGSFSLVAACSAATGSLVSTATSAAGTSATVDGGDGWSETGSEAAESGNWLCRANPDRAGPCGSSGIGPCVARCTVTGDRAGSGAAASAIPAGIDVATNGCGSSSSGASACCPASREAVSTASARSCSDGSAGGSECGRSASVRSAPAIAVSAESSVRLAGISGGGESIGLCRDATSGVQRATLQLQSPAFWRCLPIVEGCRPECGAGSGGGVEAPHREVADCGTAGVEPLSPSSTSAACDGSSRAPVEAAIITPSVDESGVAAVGGDCSWATVAFRRSSKELAALAGGPAGSGAASPGR